MKDTGLGLVQKGTEFSMGYVHGATGALRRKKNMNLGEYAFRPACTAADREYVNNKLFSDIESLLCERHVARTESAQ